jgi:hypothetical protein
LNQEEHFKALNKIYGNCFNIFREGVTLPLSACDGIGISEENKSKLFSEGFSTGAALASGCSS